MILPNISTGSGNCLVLDENRLWLKFSGEHDRHLYYRDKVNTVSSI